ncbi:MULTISPECIES: SprT family protein [unclassified Enterococcus]|uniref:SprT family protein n=1 Tax=unclassified Enterococcus TaxID=2608891 RepID=UPI002475D8F7|nr:MULTISPECIES: SprT family protein [unclassified Enterococcus]
MTNQELEVLVKEISLDFFHRPFLHETYFNARLKTTGGRYHLNDHHLDFNPLVLEKLGEEALIGVIKHELCHYHLHLTGRGYKHRDADFKNLLKQTGGSRYVKNLQEAENYWCYRCEKCQKKIYRKRRINLKKYVCGACRGKLVLEGKVVYANDC